MGIIASMVSFRTYLPLRGQIANGIDAYHLRKKSFGYFFCCLKVHQGGGLPRGLPRTCTSGVVRANTDVRGPAGVDAVHVSSDPPFPQLGSGEAYGQGRLEDVSRRGP